METTQVKAGRPVVPAERKKKNRALSLTDAEYATLQGKAALAGLGVSAYVVKSLKLS